MRDHKIPQSDLISKVTGLGIAPETVPDAAGIARQEAPLAFPRMSGHATGIRPDGSASGEQPGLGLTGVPVRAARG